MAAQVMPISSGGSYLDSPGFNHRRTKLPPSGFSRREVVAPMPGLNFDTSDLDDSLSPSYRHQSPLLNTPDSGFSGAASLSLLKTPESESSSNVVTPSSSGSGNVQRKRKTVNFDESQTSIVVISPDDLFNTYSKTQVPSREHEDEDDDAPGDYEPEDVYPLACPDDLLDDPHARYVVDSLTGWPLKRSQSLESRDNPFLPGGDLSREAEDLLRRATIIRDNFYLNEEEKKTLQEQQLLQQKQGKQPRSTKHVQIVDQDGHTYGSDSSPTSSGAVEERISPQSSNTFAAAPAPQNGDDGAQPKENGKAGELTAASPDSGKTAIPDSDGQSLPLGQTGPGSGGLSGGGELQVHDSDKKKRNKCCSVM
ncbi:unnamed protein product [Lymnaea stagnalis]|uniref:Uncharacterized protein n=1 Tax=Lymnaea stagnalis TaxID=6523 RepID=A0AAV2HCS1_LYMST